MSGKMRPDTLIREKSMRLEEDRFHIPPEDCPEGYDLQWITAFIHGRFDLKHFAKFVRRGWEPVNGEDFGGKLKKCGNGGDGQISNGEMVLIARRKGESDERD